MPPIIPEDYKKSKLKNIPIENWTRSVALYVECHGDAMMAYRRLKDEGIDYGYRRFLDFVHTGDIVRNLPPIQEIYKSHLQKEVHKARVSISKRIESTLELTDEYKKALRGKIDLLVASPKQVTRNIGAEIRHINEVELGIHRVLGESEEKLGKNNMSIEEAKANKEEALKLLASKAASDDEDEDYGLSNVMVLKKVKRT